MPLLIKLPTADRCKKIMENDEAIIYCPDELCKAANSNRHDSCQLCNTPLPKRYLWAVGGGRTVGSVGEMLQERYLIISSSVVLDTKPGLLPQIPDIENAPEIRPYLRLIPYRLYIPQPYGVVNVGSDEILLLEKPPLYPKGTPEFGKLLPELITAWHEASSIRQLNWLWQIANLWQPLKSEGVASSLLDAQLSRVEGSFIRLLELRFDTEHNPPTISSLGKFWQQLLPNTRPAIAHFLQEVCNLLLSGEIYSSELLVAVLDKGLIEVARNQTPTIQIATKTDTGPTRQRNEDACYPASGSLISKPPTNQALAIVCDGIGGHEGGNVASNLAIYSLQQQVEQLTQLPYENIEPAIVLEDLEKAAAIANDKISQQNDIENRQGRQRMGTTVVMALPIAHEVYFTHVGDSRAYWITRYGCYQITLDDDVASREVRLGYAIYREAVMQPASGSLVQALGMGPSSSLHPTTQRFVIDEDSIFVLCSDGLSDFDRVEQYWDSEILPILDQGSDISQILDQLINIANSKNGHDNVTIALLHYKVKFSEPTSPIEVPLTDIPEPKQEVSFSSPVGIESTSMSPTRYQKTKVLSAGNKNKPFNFRFWLIVAGFFSFSIACGLLLTRILGEQASSPIAIAPPPTPQTTTETPNVNPTNHTIYKNNQVEVKNKISLYKTKTPIESEELIVTAGSKLIIIDEAAIKNIPGDKWLRLQTCIVSTDSESVTTNTTPKVKTDQEKPKEEKGKAKNIIQKGQQGWIQLSSLLRNALITNSSNPETPSQCESDGQKTPSAEKSPSSGNEVDSDRETLPQKNR
jgi:protein phosphatase